jgi:hypothetical protein
MSYLARVLVILLVVATLIPVSGGAQSLSCGLRPLPKLGCRIGRCVDGAWEQICDRSPELSCGLRPLPKLGCRIGRCVNGVWEQVCS